MLFIKVVPENYGKILKRCFDLNRDFLEEHEESERKLGLTTAYYVTAPGWFDGSGRSQRYSALFPEHLLNEEMDLPHGKSDTDWFQATRKKS